MIRPRPCVLVVEGKGDAASALAAFLRERGFTVLVAHDGESAGATLDKRRVDALYHERVLAMLQQGFKHQALAESSERVSGELDRRRGVDALVGGSQAMERVREQVRQIAPTRSSVLLVGEEGTGRSVVARAIHQASPRRGERFVWLDAAALPPETIEAELFGDHDEAAQLSRPGRVELADGGTLFVDNIEHLPERAQLRLLRVLQDRVLDRPGAGVPLRVDVRVLAATTRELADDVRAGRFRADLSYRLDVVRIALPPLRERREDIPLLAEHLLRQIAREHGRRPRRVTRGALERLRRHAWPGNVSELARTLESVVLASKGREPIDVSSLPEPLREVDVTAGRLELSVGMTAAEAERQLFEATLRQTGGNKVRAAAMLGVGLRTLYRKLEKYRLH